MASVRRQGPPKAVDGGDGPEDGRGPGHVGLHLVHVRRGFEADAAAIEGDSLAHEDQRLLVAVRGAVEHHHPRRHAACPCHGGKTPPGGKGVALEDLHRPPGLLAHGRGLVGQRGGGEEIGRGIAEVPGQGHSARDALRPADVFRLGGDEDEVRQGLGSLGGSKGKPIAAQKSGCGGQQESRRGKSGLREKIGMQDEFCCRAHATEIHGLGDEAVHGGCGALLGQGHGHHHPVLAEEDPGGVVREHRARGCLAKSCVPEFLGGGRQGRFWATQKQEGALALGLVAGSMAKFHRPSLERNLDTGRVRPWLGIVKELL